MAFDPRLSISGFITNLCDTMQLKTLLKLALTFINNVIIPGQILRVFHKGFCFSLCHFIINRGSGNLKISYDLLEVDIPTWIKILKKEDLYCLWPGINSILGFMRWTIRHLSGFLCLPSWASASQWLTTPSRLKDVTNEITIGHKKSVFGKGLVHIGFITYSQQWKASDR